jgi:hypothetical protein
MISDSRIRELALGLFKQESARDKQKKIGASDFSDPCEYHIAKKLLGLPSGEFKYWMGAKVGTAIHEFLEKRIESVDLEEFPEFTGALVEQSILLGELEGYGTIKSKPDLALVEGKHLVDWKTSKREKSRQLQSAVYGEAKETKVYAESMYTLKRYFAQAQIYAWGLNKQGTEIDACSLVFINRDGTYDPDVWTWTFPYDEKFAESMWARLSRIWGDLQAEKPLEDFPKEEYCFDCKVLEA